MTRMAKAIHTMIRVRDLERSLAFYRDAFGFEEVHRLDFPTFALVYARNAENDFEIEFTLNKDRSEPYTHGDGYGHVAMCVDDVPRERERLTRLGVTPGDVKEFKDASGSLIARYFFVEDPDGYKIEVLERHGHYR
jgi:lactoylglutathione lyase